MWKRLFKNVILAVCCLALVFQPITICAASFNFEYVQSWDNYTIYLPNNSSITFVDDTSSNFISTAQSFLTSNYASSLINAGQGDLLNTCAYYISGSTGYVFLQPSITTNENGSNTLPKISGSKAFRYYNNSWSLYNSAVQLIQYSTIGVPILADQNDTDQFQSIIVTTASGYTLYSSITDDSGSGNSNMLQLVVISKLDDIKRELVSAFPPEQALINDTIAQEVTDNTQGYGLTSDRISDTRQTINEGLDTFNIDTSGSQYSNPFSALGDADWSFWSQTTLNNLGSSYSYSFSEGSLMSEDDIFTENQNTLLDLLGW